MVAINPTWKKKFNIATLRIEKAMEDLETKWNGNKVIIEQKQVPNKQGLDQGAVDAPQYGQYNKEVPAMQNRKG